VTSRLNLVFCATLTRVSRDNAPALVVLFLFQFIWLRAQMSLAADCQIVNQKI
jgi:hypothetical protein